MKNSSFWLLVALLGLTPLLAWAEEAPDDSSNVVATYPVQNGVLAGKPSADHKALWAGVQALIPAPLLKLVATLEIFQVADNPDAETATDGYAVLGEDGTTFTLGLNLDSARAAFVDRDPVALPEYQRTILHEFGHILSFQASQRDETGSVTDTLTLDEGTLTPGSYLNQFHLKFWKSAFPDRDATTQSDADGTALFQRFPGSFVTEYAATGPLEDFAESFAWFVAEETPRGTQIKDQKVRFFSSWPELVSLRTAVRPAIRALVTP